MQLEEYKGIIQNNADPAMLSVWGYLAKNARETADNVKAHDPNLALILRGMANQYSQFLVHVEKKQTQFNQEAIKAEELKPIDSAPSIEVTEDEIETTTENQ